MFDSQRTAVGSASLTSYSDVRSRIVELVLNDLHQVEM